jgi:hypothetical protein
MVFAIVRVISLDTSVRATGQVSTTWLILWASLEGAVGMLCPPPFSKARLVINDAKLTPPSLPQQS